MCHQDVDLAGEEQCEKKHSPGYLEEEVEEEPPGDEQRLQIIFMFLL